MRTRIQKTTMGALLGLCLVSASPAFAGEWRWIPAGINASRGDAVLSADGEGVIGALLGSINQSWTHSGMALDSGYTIRHNTMYMENIDVIYNTFLGIKTTPKYLNGGQLQSGQPGIITESTSNAYGADGTVSFVMYTNKNGVTINNNALVLKPKDESAWRSRLNSAAAQMTSVNAYYNVYAYTNHYDFTWSSSKTTSRGHHCSGTIWWANNKAGNIFPTTYYSSSLRMTGANVLYNSLKQAVADDAGWFGNIILSLFDSGAKDRIASQVVNCFAFDDCWNTTGRWKNGVGSGTAVSPDNLLPTGYSNLGGYYWGNQDTNGAYSKPTPMAYYGGYWKWFD